MTELILNPGGLRDPVDTRDLQWESLAKGTVEKYDWDEKYRASKELEKKISGLNILTKHQDDSGSCGGQATSFHDAIEEAFETGTYEEESAKSIIARTFVMSGNVMLGSFMRDNLALTTGAGIPREILCPSYPKTGRVTDEFMNRPQDITAEALIDGLKRKGKSYGYVTDVTNIDTVMQAIKANRGAQMLIRGQNGKGWYGLKPGITETPEWGHFMYLDGGEIINGKKYIWAKQSWGDEAGEDGWQLFSEDWFKSGFIQQIGLLIRPNLPLPAEYKFTRDLALGSTGPDVKILQHYLNTHGAPVAQSGPGSLGNETTYFGSLTKFALARFQHDHNINPAVGYFGPLTRKFING